MCCRFTKNLAADKINVSTLKGEGDLSDLELDELMLTDLLDLPTWLRLTKATCNKLTIKVSSTMSHARTSSSLIKLIIHLTIIIVIRYIGSVWLAQLVEAW